MAGGESLGSLYFDLGLDDKTFEAVFNATMKKYDNKFNIKVGIDATGIAATQKQINELLSVSSKPMTQYSAGKLGLLAAESAKKQKLSQQKINTELEKTALAHKRNEDAGTKSQSRIRSNAEFTNKTLLSQRQLALQISNQFGTMFSIYAVERFVKKLAEVRGEFELQKVSLRSVLQDAPAADAIFEKVKNLALTSPFTFKELSGYTKQLSAMSIPAKDLFDTMKKLADVSAGVGVGMDRIVLAYGQVKAAGVLRGQELRQFSEAGINIVELLANKFTKLKGQVVTSADVFDMISKKMVSFGMVSEIFDDMTSAGGKFYKMQEVQAATLSGMISNLTDAYELGLNTIGESNDALLKGTVQIMTLLARNMESVAKIALAIAAAYGTYRAVLITSNILQAINAKIAYQQMLANIGNTGATIKLTTAQGLQAVVASRLTGIQVSLNRAMVASPIVAASLAILALAGFMAMYANSAEKAVNYTEEFASINKEAEKSTKAEINTLESLRKILNYSTSSYKDKKYALTELQKIVPAYHASLTKEGGLINNNTKALDDYAAKLVTTEKIKIAAQKQAAAEEEFSSYASSTKDVLSEALRKRSEASASGKYDNPDDVLMAGEKAALATWTRLAKNVGVYGDAIEALRKELMLVGTSTPQVLGGDSGADKTDYVAKNLENQIKLVKNLYSEYSKLKGVQGADLAKSVITSDSDYASSRNALKSFGVSPTFTEDAMNVEISKLILRTEQTKKVKEIGVAFASGIDKGFADKKNEAFRNIFKSIEQTISDYRPKYDLYEKLLGLTGDRKKSSQLAFGRDAVDDYETFLRAQYAKMPSATFFSELTPPAEGATEEVKKAWKDLVEYIQSKKLGKIEYFEQIISEASSASEKIKVIELKREQDILEAKKAFASDPAQMKLAIDAVRSTSEQQINEIRSQLFQLTPLYDEVFKDLGKVAAGNLDALLDKTKGLVDLVKTKGEAKKGTNGETTGYFLKAGVTDPNSGLKIEKDTLISVEKYNDLIERTNTIVSKINENPFKALFNPPKGATSETVEEKAKRIAWAIQGISDVANSVAGDLGTVMDSFGASSESKESLNNIMNLATGTAQAGVGVAKLASGDIVGGVKDLASGIVKVVGSLNAMHDAKYEKQIKALQKQIDATAKSYDNLSEALTRKTEASKIDAQAEEYNLLQREKNLLEAQKRAEESKKKTDQAKIDDYNKQIEDASKKQQELALNTIQYVLGGTIGAQADSWAKTLTDAMDTAFQNGTDAAQAWGDSVDSIVRDIAKNFIVNSFLGKQLQGWLEEASKDWTDADKNINQANIEADLKGFSVFAKSLEPATEAALKALNSIYGDGKTGASGTGLTGEIKGVTEDTAQRLASLLNAIRQDSGVNRLAFAEMKNILSEFNRGSIEANSYLLKINENTRLTAENTAAIVRAFNDVTGIGNQGKALRIL